MIGRAKGSRSHEFGRHHPLAAYGETATDPESGIECLPHNSPLVAVLLGLAAGKPAEVKLPAGPSILTVISIRNPSPAELARLLAAIKSPEIENQE